MNVLENPFGPLMDDPELIKKIEKILSKKFEPVRSEEDEKDKKSLLNKVDGRSSAVQDFKSRVSSGATRSNASSRVDVRSKAFRDYKYRVAKRSRSNRRNGK